MNTIDNNLKENKLITRHIERKETKHQKHSI